MTDGQSSFSAATKEINKMDIEVLQKLFHYAAHLQHIYSTFTAHYSTCTVLFCKCAVTAHVLLCTVNVLLLQTLEQ